MIPEERKKEDLDTLAEWEVLYTKEVPGIHYSEMQ